MSRSKKGYDVLTFFIACNIMGGIGIPLVPASLDVYGLDSLGALFTISIVLGIIGGLIAAVAVSRLVPIGEKTVLYMFFSGTFIFSWTNITVVVSAIQEELQTNFPLSAVVLFFGMFLFVITLFSMGGADIER
jgi:hypothetical protein